MNEPLDPKRQDLADFERRLRTLRPLEVELPSPDIIRTKRKTRRYFRNIFAAASVAVLFVAIVFYGTRERIVVEPREPVDVAVTVAVTVDVVSPAESPESHETPVFSTVRSQLVTLLNEMPPPPPEPIVKRDYPVIEITVTKTEAPTRDEFSGILRGGSRIDFDPEKPFWF